MTSRRDPASRPLTAADLERLTDRIGVKIDGLEGRIEDQRAEDKAQADARQKVTREARAEDQARLDSLTEEVARQGRRGEEILATTTRGYRALETAQNETKEAIESRVKALEERAAPEAAEIAMHVGQTVVGANRQDNRRIAGAVMVTGGVGFGALVMTVINFIANHTTFVIGVLRVLSLGIVKATGGSHE